MNGFAWLIVGLVAAGCVGALWYQIGYWNGQTAVLKEWREELQQERNAIHRLPIDTPQINP